MQGDDDYYHRNKGELYSVYYTLYYRKKGGVDASNNL